MGGQIQSVYEDERLKEEYSIDRTRAIHYTLSLIETNNMIETTTLYSIYQEYTYQYGPNSIVVVNTAA